MKHSSYLEVKVLDEKDESCRGSLVREGHKNTLDDGDEVLPMPDVPHADGYGEIQGQNFFWKQLVLSEKQKCYGVLISR